MTRERHIEYAKAITELQASAGKAVRSTAITHLKRVLELSRGNLQAFKKLLALSEKQYMKSVLKIVIQQQMKARQIGKEFASGL